MPDESSEKKTTDYVGAFIVYGKSTDNKWAICAARYKDEGKEDYKSNIFIKARDLSTEANLKEVEAFNESKKMTFVMGDEEKRLAIRKKACYNTTCVTAWDYSSVG